MAHRLDNNGLESEKTNSLILIVKTATFLQQSFNFIIHDSSAIGSTFHNTTHKFWNQISLLWRNKNKKKFHIQNHNKCVLQLGLLLCHCINFLSMKAETKNYFMVFPIFMLYNNEIRKIKNRWENYDSCVVVFILISFHSQHIYIYDSRDKEKSRTKCLGWYEARAYLILFKLFKLESLSWSVFVAEWFCTSTL